MTMRADHPLLFALEMFHQVERVLLTLGGAKFAAQLSFHSTEKIEFGVVRLKNAVSGSLGYFVLFEGRDQLGSHQHDRLGLDGLNGVGANQGPTIGRSPSPGIARRGGVRDRLQQARDRQRLAFPQLDYGSALAR